VFSVEHHPNLESTAIMHPRQASLLNQAQEITEKLAAKKNSAPKPGGGVVLWQYTDDAGNQFYLEEKKMTGVRSPFTGKTVSTKPVKHTPGQVGKEMKDEAKAAKTASSF
jgi:hypothetical protein